MTPAGRADPSRRGTGSGPALFLRVRTIQAKDIRPNGRYLAKVNGKLTTVRVLLIQHNAEGKARYRVRNEATGRLTVFRSAGKFRCPAEPKPAPAPARDSLHPEGL